CCQSHRAVGEAAGVGRRPRTQAAVAEEGAPERVLHRHQRGGRWRRWGRTSGCTLQQKQTLAEQRQVTQLAFN
ncbi:unnamed protein product, partial [Tetraodon nigroviridis]